MSKIKVRPKTHNEMRKSVCVNCLAPGCHRTVTNKMTVKIREFVVGDFAQDVESLPQGICEPCRLSLHRNGKLVCSIEYKNLRKRGTFKCFHGKENYCECYICVAGRHTQFKPKVKRTTKSSDTMKTCAKCLARLAPGQPHDCRDGARVENVLKWLPNDVAQQVTTKVVTDEAGDSSSATLKRLKGPRMTVNLGKIPEKVRPLSHQDMLNFKRKYNASNRETLEFAHDYRTLHGKHSVESFLGDHLVDITDTEEEFLTLTTIRIKNGEGEFIEKVCVIVKDLQAVIDHIKRERSIKDDVCLVKLLGDTGGNFFKICLSTIDLDKVRELLAKPKAPSKYADGPFLVDNNDNGINALFIIAMVPKCKEDYLLVSQVIDLLKLQNLREPRWISGGDQKYINLICGVGEHSSHCPCSWCSLPKTGFRMRLPYELRTWGHLRRCNEALLAAGPKAQPKDFFSVKNRPMMPFEDDKLVIEGVVPCELHYLLRSFNHLWNSLSIAWKDTVDTTVDLAAQFAISVNAVSNSYRGHDFNGNACRRLLKNLDKLAVAAPPELAPYIKCLSDLNAVVTSCFSVAGPQGTKYIDELEAFYKSAIDLVDVSFTPTLHGVVEHVADFFNIWGTEFGLGLYGEQAGESVHYDFESTIYTSAYKRPESHPEFGPKLLRAVAAYNSLHLNARPRAP